MDAKHWSLATFEPLVGSTFRIPTTDSDSLELTLVSATPARISPLDARSRGSAADLRAEPFSLLFTGDRRQRLEQGIYRTVDAAETERSIFLAPVGQTADGEPLYEAVFN